METFSALLAFCAGNSPGARSFDIFFDLCLNKQLSKPSSRWWFETPSHPLWHHCNAPCIFNIMVAYVLATQGARASAVTVLAKLSRNIPVWTRDELTHWGRVRIHASVNKTIIGSDNGLSPGRRQAIIWTNAGILLIEHLGTNFSEISIKILTFSFAKMCLKVSSAKWRPFCLVLNVLISHVRLG